MARGAVQHPRIGNLRTQLEIFGQATTQDDGRGGITDAKGASKGIIFAEVRTPTSGEAYMAGRNEQRLDHIITARDEPGGFPVEAGDTLVMVENPNRSFRIQALKRVQERGVWIMMDALEQGGEDGASC